MSKKKFEYDYRYRLYLLNERGSFVMTDAEDDIFRIFVKMDSYYYYFKQPTKGCIVVERENDGDFPIFSDHGDIEKYENFKMKYYEPLVEEPKTLRRK